MLEALGVSWAQLAAHTVGFLIALVLLKKFAWGPMMDLMDERRDKITGEFDRIEQEKKGVADLTAQYEAKLREIDNERRAKLLEAVNEGKKIAEEIKATAREEVKQLQVKAKADINREIAKAKVQLRDEMVAITMTAAEKIIRERLDDEKHRNLIGNFIDNIEKV